MRFFNYCTGLTMTNSRFDALFGGPPRAPDAPLTQRDMDVARSIQAVTEEVMLRLARTLQRESGRRHLCLAGGVALNCVGNGRILREGPFDDLWIQPAAGDAGGAIGAALTAWHGFRGAPRHAAGDAMRGSFLGPSFGDDEIERILAGRGARYERLDDRSLCERVAQALARGLVVGWFQGRMEFGPRALGARSILGDPRSPRMQSILNLKIKFRESFRPFAPAVLRERAAEYFDLEVDSPYMLLIVQVADRQLKPVPPEQSGLTGLERLALDRSTIPAVTHVDRSARVQTVDAGTNPRFYQLLRAFDALTGCPVVANTSFNVRGEPIVCTPDDAYRCFMRTEMDLLVLERLVLDKHLQPSLAADERHPEFEAD
jgi:carbamoyltransferase